jgi:peroxiredoxin
MLALGTPMPSFHLRSVDGETISSDKFKTADATLVAFLCPHCPYVRHIRQGVANFAREYAAKGLAVVAINSNDLSVSPNDNPAAMKEEIQTVGYAFPYLIDEDQSVAKAFNAACTPDFFLFDHSGKLAYRGQFDGSRPGNDVPVSGTDMRRAADAVLSKKQPQLEQAPSVGCNIKWRPGNEPNYAH